MKQSIIIFTFFFLLSGICGAAINFDGRAINSDYIEIRILNRADGDIFNVGILINFNGKGYEINNNLYDHAGNAIQIKPDKIWFANFMKKNGYSLFYYDYDKETRNHVLIFEKDEPCN